MRRQPLTRWCALGCAALAVACSHETGSSTATTTSTGPSGPGAGGGGAGGGGGDGGGGEVPNTECVDTAAVPTEVYPAGTALRLDRITAVGPRFLATGEAGYVFFDGDGANADATPTVLRDSRHVAASEGDVVAIAAFDMDWLSVQRFDANGLEQTGLGGVTQTLPQLTDIAHASFGTPIVWAFNTRLYGRTLFPESSMSPVFDVAIGAYKTFVFLVAGARGDEVGVAWSGDATLGANQSFFTRITSDGPTGDMVELHESVSSHSVTGVAGTDDGYVVLLTGEPPDFTPLLARLDAEGRRQGNLRALDGALFAQGIAGRGARLAVVTGRATGEVQMRVFESDLTPAGPWVCLGANFDAVRPAAIAAIDGGYAVLHTSADGALILHRTDDTGEGAL